MVHVGECEGLYIGIQRDQQMAIKVSQEVKKMDCWNIMVEFIGRPRIERKPYKLMDDERTRFGPYCETTLSWSQVGIKGSLFQENSFEEHKLCLEEEAKKIVEIVALRRSTHTMRTRKHG